jgi:aspartyl protease family protein
LRLILKVLSVFIALCATNCAAIAQSVAFSGSLGKKALLVINGGSPRSLAPGESHDGVKLVSVNGDLATVEIGGRQQTLTMGVAASGVSSSQGNTAVFTADTVGHFVTAGLVNERVTVKFLVDTGASTVLISPRDATAAGIPYANAPTVSAQTANGLAYFYRVRIDTLKIGDIVLKDIEAAVSRAPMEVSLLGMSFLNKVEMRRVGDTMTLVKRGK